MEKYNNVFFNRFEKKRNHLHQWLNKYSTNHLHHSFIKQVTQITLFYTSVEPFASLV